MAKAAKYSNNFFRNKDGKAMSKEAKKNMYKVASVHSKDVRSTKYIPVATGALMASVTGAKKNTLGFYIESIDYISYNSGSRYNSMAANREYLTKNGTLIPAGKNANKGKWFDRCFKNNDIKYIKIANEGVIK